MRSLRNPFVQVGIWTLGIGAVLSVVVLSVPWLPEEASTQAGTIDTLYDVLAVISCFVFALVMSILLVSVIHFRRRHNDLSDGEPIHGNTTPRGGLDRDPRPADGRRRGLQRRSCSPTSRSRRPNTQTVDVTGQQFAWTFKYAGQGTSAPASSTSSRARRTTSSSTPRT